MGRRNNEREEKHHRIPKALSTVTRSIQVHFTKYSSAAIKFSQRVQANLSNISQHSLPSSTRTNFHIAARKLRAKLPSDEYLRGGGQVLFCTILLGTGVALLRRGLVRFTSAEHIPRRLFSSRGARYFRGTVVRVGDGDGIRVVHRPFLRRVFDAVNGGKSHKRLGGSISIRLSGVDAPECAHFGRAGQRYGTAARDWLRKFALGRDVCIRPHNRDQYRRVVASVQRLPRNSFVRALGIGRKDLSMELVKAGYAVVYDGAGAQYGGKKDALVKAMNVAKKKGIGMWKEGTPALISPMEFKKMLRSAEGSVRTHVLNSDVVEQGRDAVRFGQRLYRFLKSLR